jgi:5-methylcytosine-specific restriction endonuclease McrA
MSSIHAKPVRYRLEPNLYDQIRLQVLRRDGWRCQACGIMSNLEVHHIEFRSHSGSDSEENLITMCTACHHEIHHIIKVKSKVSQQGN